MLLSTSSHETGPLVSTPRPVSALRRLPQETPGLHSKEPIGNAEFWLPGHTWLLGGAAPRRPKAPDPQVPCQVQGTSLTQPASQPSVATWCPHGGAPRASRHSVASPPKPRGLPRRETWLCRGSYLARSSVDCPMARVNWGTCPPGTDHGYSLTQTRGQPLPS